MRGLQVNTKGPRPGPSGQVATPTAQRSPIGKGMSDWARTQRQSTGVRDAVFNGGTPDPDGMHWVQMCVCVCVRIHMYVSHTTQASGVCLLHSDDGRAPVLTAQGHAPPGHAAPGGAASPQERGGTGSGTASGRPRTFLGRCGNS